MLRIAIAVGWLVALASCRGLLGLEDRATDDAMPPDDANCPTFYADRDQDGHGDPNAPMVACVRPDGVSESGDDCDDQDRYRAPDLVEVCDQLDNDCNNQVDDNGCSIGCTALRRPAPNDATAYIRCTNQINWTAARAACGSWGFHLIYIETGEENTWLRNQFSFAGAIWIGATDQVQSNHWIWGNGVAFWDSGQTLTYAAWAATQPDNIDTESCAEMDFSGWADRNCGANNGYVCER